MGLGAILWRDPQVPGLSPAEIMTHVSAQTLIKCYDYIYFKYQQLLGLLAFSRRACLPGKVILFIMCNV